MHEDLKLLIETASLATKNAQYPHLRCAQYECVPLLQTQLRELIDVHGDVGSGAVEELLGQEHIHSLRKVKIIPKDVCAAI